MTAPILKVAGKSCNLQTPKMQGDVGYDLVCDELAYINPGKIEVISTGVHVQLPEGYWARIAGRSSAAAKGLFVVEGIIDTGYTGELFLRIINMNVKTYRVQPGDRLAQLILHQRHVFVVCDCDIEDFDATERSAQGFGSTG